MSCNEGVGGVSAGIWNKIIAVACILEEAVSGLLQIVAALNARRLVSGGFQGGKEQAGQDHDHGNYNEEFYKSEFMERVFPSVPAELVVFWYGLHEKTPDLKFAFLLIRFVFRY